MPKKHLGPEVTRDDQEERQRELEPEKDEGTPSFY